MKPKLTTLALLALVALTMTARQAQPQSPKYAQGVPMCGHVAWRNDYADVVNSCNSEVTIAWTSRGSCFGTAIDLASGAHRGTGCSQKDLGGGELEIFTCPGDSTPVDRNGRPIYQHYSGEYACHY